MRGVLGRGSAIDTESVRAHVTLAAIFVAGTVLLGVAAGAWRQYVYRGGAGVVSASSLPQPPIKSRAAYDYVNAHWDDAWLVQSIGIGVDMYVTDLMEPRTRENRSALLEIAQSYRGGSRTPQPYYGVRLTFGSPDGTALGKAEAELTAGAKDLQRAAAELFAPRPHSLAPGPVIQADALALFKRGRTEWNRAVRTIWLDAGVSRQEHGWPLTGINEAGWSP